MGTVNRRLGLLLSLAPIGAASLIYVVIVRGFIEGDTGHSLAWPLLGILPMFVFGMWLLTVTSSRSGVFLAAAATAGAVGSAYETFVQRNPELIYEPWFRAVQHDRTDRGCGDHGRDRQPVRDVPHRGSRAQVAADRRVADLDPRAGRAARSAHDPVCPAAGVHRHECRRIGEPLRRAVARVGGTPDRQPRLPAVARRRGRALPCSTTVRSSAVPRSVRAPGSWRRS